MINVSDKICRENQNTFFVQYLFFPENFTIYEIMGENIVEPDRPQMTIWNMRISCCILNSTNIHSEYVIHIAFLLQQ